METETESEKYTISHLGIIRLFAVWGLLDAFIHYTTKDNKEMEVVIHIIVFILINVIAYRYPKIIKYL